MTYTISATSSYDMKKVKAHLELLHEVQPGDPAKGAKAIYEISKREAPPLRVVLGSDGYTLLGGYLKQRLDELQEDTEISLSTDADDVVKN